MEPIRTHAGGLYQIYGRDGDAPWNLATDKLDTSLSLGVGKMGAEKWTPGLRDNAEACEAQIAAYAERWAHKDDLPKPEILVLGEHDDKGDYTGRYTFTVIDGAMWVAAAKKAGIAQVPVLVIHPTLPHLEPEAMWIYFNKISHGLAPTDRQYTKILKDLAKCARGRGVTDAVKVTVKEHGQDVSKKASAQWVADYARATATSVRDLTEITKGIWATRRSDEQRVADLEKFKREVERRLTANPPEKLEGVVGWLADESHKTKTAIRKWLKSVGMDLPKSKRRPRGSTPRSAPVNTNGAGAPVLTGGATSNGSHHVPAGPVNGNGRLNGEVKEAAQLLTDAVTAIEPFTPLIINVIDRLERFTANGDDAEKATLSERPEARAQTVHIWTTTLDNLLAELLRLANDLDVYADYERARRDAVTIAKAFRVICETLQRNQDVARLREMNGAGADHQMTLIG